MQNTNGSFFGNLTVLICGFAGAYNFKILIRNLRYGQKYEEVLKENEDLKKQIIGLKDKIIGNEAIISAQANTINEHDNRKKR